MRTLAFDGRMGASGDMVLAALLAAGADDAVFDPVEVAIDVRYEVGEATRNGIGVTTVDVLVDDEAGDSNGGDDHGHGDPDSGHDHADGGHDHDHDHSDDDHSHGEADHSHTDDHSHDDTTDHTHAEGHGPHRSYREVVELVEGMDLPDDVTSDALAIFEILGTAEAAVHGTDLEETHFHEVGADDAIADVVGACLLVDDLAVDRVVTTPLSAGSGEVEMSHGTYPIPAPAVIEIAEQADWSLRGGPVEAELLTPTGAAILAHFAEGVAELPSMEVQASGYGAGGYSFEDRPNVLRALVGESDGPLVRDEITVLETNVDDVAPEVLGDLQRSLKDAGARDVSILPATMKKARPGHLVKVICKPEDAQRVARRLAEETGTLGVREHGADHRWIAHREIETVAITVEGEAYPVDVKIASDDEGVVFDVSAEYDDAAAVADETGMAVRDVLRRAEDVVRDLKGE
ncbi:nickel pincer cofactor biosynthesis protein LarC [Halobacteria archaeon HArc-gm2]|nr:nickel pincer cofactor biosynthesis protein LarC [Halobacteria archaeon HArc-gm2]